MDGMSLKAEEQKIYKDIAKEDENRKPLIVEWRLPAVGDAATNEAAEGCSCGGCN